MLTPDYLDTLPDALVELWQQVEDDILRDIARRIGKADDLTDTAAWQAWRLEQVQACHQDVIRLLAKYSGKNKEIIRQLLLDAGVQTLASDDEIYTALGFSPSAIDTNEALNNLLNAGYHQTLGTWQNLTATTAHTVTGEFERALDRAWLQVSSGAFDYKTAIKRAVDSLADHMAGVTYPSGHRDTLEVASRRAVLTGVNQTAAKLQLARADEMGCEFVEVSAHAGARPEHAVWQGKVYHRGGGVELDGVWYADFEAATGYGTGPGLCGWNCRHNFYPFFPGVSEPNYSESELKNFYARDIAFDGKKYTRYEISQMQRALERQVRKYKRRYLAEDTAGVDTTASAARLRAARQRLSAFVQATGGRSDSSRTDVAGFGHSQASKATAVAKKQERLDAVNNELNQASRRGILNPSHEGNGGNPDVNFVCKLDRELYKVVTDDIQTDEVIITDEQIAHIEEGHPGAYSQFMQYLPRTIQDPDYILRGNKPNTALVLKRIVEEEAITEVVLRIKVASDPVAYRNSIITLWHIGPKRFRRLLRQSEILYKKE